MCNFFLKVVFVLMLVQGLALPAVYAQGRSGEAVYRSSCISCHASGAAGAPRLGDKAAWAPRLIKGKPTLYKHVQQGFKGMPPKGMCMTCTEAEIRAAVDYMVR